MLGTWSSVGGEHAERGFDAHVQHSVKSVAIRGS